MRSELEKILYEKYPHFFAQKTLLPTESLMCFGIECAGGWFDLLDKTIGKIVKVCPQAQAVQIKEKFGTLRLYMSNSNERAEKIADQACSKTFKICEICGAGNAKQNNKGWIFTLCKACAKEVKKRGFSEVANDQLYLFAKRAYKKKK